MRRFSDAGSNPAASVLCLLPGPRGHLCLSGLVIANLCQQQHDLAREPVLCLAGIVAMKRSLLAQPAGIDPAVAVISLLHGGALRGPRAAPNPTSSPDHPHH